MPNLDVVWKALDPGPDPVENPDMFTCYDTLCSDVSATATFETTPNATVTHTFKWQVIAIACRGNGDFDYGVTATGAKQFAKLRFENDAQDATRKPNPPHPTNDKGCLSSGG